MPTYVMLANWTDQGARQVKELPRRLDAAKKALIDMGGEFKSLYMTLGRIRSGRRSTRRPTTRSRRVSACCSGSSAAVRTTTLKAFPEAAYREIINSLG